ncbi:MAG: nuclear transport factor 2 family protein [Cyclobacteriaceae bacterium]
MKVCFLSAILALFVACDPPAKAQSNVSDQDIRTLTDLKIVSFAKAYEEQDTVLLDQILHEKYQLVDDGGEVYSKASEMDYVSKYGASYDSFEFTIQKLDVFENGTAMIFGLGSIAGSDIQGSYSQTYKSTDVFVKEGGKWKAITTHVSGVKEIRE